MRKITIGFYILIASALFGEGQISFENGVPLRPHTVLQLTKNQLKIVRNTKFNYGGSKPVKILTLWLTAKQKKLLKERSGKSVEWVEARSQEAFEGDCTCGDANTAVLYEKKIAVLHDFIEPNLTLQEYQNH